MEWILGVRKPCRWVCFSLSANSSVPSTLRPSWAGPIYDKTPRISCEREGMLTWIASLHVKIPRQMYIDAHWTKQEMLLISMCCLCVRSGHCLCHEVLSCPKTVRLPKNKTHGGGPTHEMAHEMVSVPRSLTFGALLVFHTFSGCDSPFRFSGRGGKTTWDVWKSLSWGKNYTRRDCLITR